MVVFVVVREMYMAPDGCVCGCERDVYGRVCGCERDVYGTC